VTIWLLLCGALDTLKISFVEFLFCESDPSLTFVVAVSRMFVTPLVFEVFFYHYLSLQDNVIIAVYT
jgi:hypothetical protein